MKSWIVRGAMLMIIAGGVYEFFHKNSISFETVYRVPNDEKFRPLGYEFFHSRQELESYFKRNNRTKDLRGKLSEVEFDFVNYSYCIFYGRKITTMSYSYKATYFDDITPTYARPKGKIPVFVTYDAAPSSERGTFIYRVSKDDRLRGFYD